jgi:predicted RNA-binding protein YlxR (DUF448 family)
MSKKRHVPARMCIGCRKKKKKEEMIRFIDSPKGFVLSNEKNHLNGRGFYLCPDLMCLKMAQKKTRWARSLESMNDRYPLWSKGIA